uniref:Tripartite motif-containing protein 35-like n=1 Tax=Sparus aurata TaxID=8175 RepID=A0A671WMI6_SPAAU
MTTPVAIPKLLKEYLDELDEKTLKEFQWDLIQIEIDGSRPIPRSKLENATRVTTVDKLVEAFGEDGAVARTVETLLRMNHFDLASRLIRGKIKIVVKVIFQTKTQNICSLQMNFFLFQSSLYEASLYTQLKLFKKLLKKCLDDLTKEKLQEFQWHLIQIEIDGYQPLPQSHLENATIVTTVDKLVEAFGEDDAVERTVETLREIKRNDLYFNSLYICIHKKYKNKCFVHFYFHFYGDVMAS